MRLRRIVVTALLSLFAGVAPASSQLAADNPIVLENQQPGSSGWFWSKAGDDATGQIKGYASATSVNQGESITFYVTVNPAQTYTIDFYRIGWYGGMGGRLRLHVDSLGGVQQPPCDTDPTTGLIACNWAPSYTLTVPGDWTSGIYAALLTNAQGYQNYVMFVVRDGRPAPFLYQQSIATGQAYNNYPNDGRTGKSLYFFNSYGANTVSKNTSAVKVSFDRPYADSGSADFFNWEVNLVRWLERSGYDVTYSTDIDTHANGGELQNHKAFFSVGHDEYWSKEMFDAAEAARGTGVNLAFFGGNAVYTQVRFEPSAAGVANRVMVCYRNQPWNPTDPVQGPTTTTEFRSPPVNRPEQTLIGIMSAAQLPMTNYVVINSSHWVYAGTGFQDGDVVPGIVGYEADSYWPNFPPPNSANQTLLSRSPFTYPSNGLTIHLNSSIYQAPSGAWVFAAGTMSWSWALDDVPGPFSHFRVDSRIQRATANVLNAFLTGAPVVKVLVGEAPATVTAGQAFTVAVTAENDQGNPVAQYGGTVHFSSSDSSAGVVLPADATLTNGQGSFSVTLVGAGSQTVTVADAANSLSTTVTVIVRAASAERLALTTTAAPTAGQAFSFSETAQDPFGNTDPAYAGRVHFTSSDTSAGVVLPPDSSLSNGQGTFSATLVRAGSPTITGTDTVTASLTGSMPVTVRAASATSISLGVPAVVIKGASFTVTVTLKDQFGNVATGYTGTVHFEASDPVSPLEVLPPDYTFTSNDAGSRAFSVTLWAPSKQTISVTDTANLSLTYTSPTIAVVVRLPGL